jgi:hypothetical protein
VSDHAQGAHAAPLPKWSTKTFDQADVEDPVQQPPNPTVDQPDSNIVQRVDIRTIAVDAPNDSDYDDPYPGGSTPDLSLGIPT